ncbi:hypothetical protein [Nocardia sp. alder85J]|uniref:hypothetical protein n=1 Tax=Nocardia sp. alder85J TaxID=2862949 RepID=UPI002254802D|nr:hypothetical protein [Nocardia sp. alder85J]MCX4094466.1 hypothetical protein [Nocardia sp. alder85J]
MLDTVAGEWVSFAEKVRRGIEGRNARWCQQARACLGRQLDDVRGVVPAGWTMNVDDPVNGLPCIRITPPAGRTDVSARLYPPHDELPGGWYVRIDNRTRHMDFPLYLAGGVHAAFFTTAAIAARRAVRMVRGELLASC